MTDSRSTPAPHTPPPARFAPPAVAAGMARIPKAAPNNKLSEERKQQILAIVSAGEAMHHDAQYFRDRVKEVASRIPDFASFSELAVRDLHQTFHHHRAMKLGGVGNRKKMWLGIFRHWARRNGETRDVVIKSRDYFGSYECFLERRVEPDWWDRLIEIGLYKGVPLHALTSFYLQHKDNPVVTVRANKRVSAPGVGQPLPPDSKRENDLAAFRRIKAAAEK